MSNHRRFLLFHLYMYKTVIPAVRMCLITRKFLLQREYYTPPAPLTDTHTTSFSHPSTSLPTPHYFLTLLACLTKFSITPSNASFSLTPSSLLFNQYSSTSLALPVISSSLATCTLNSPSSIPSSAASVVEHRILVSEISRSGGGAGPLRRALRDLVPGDDVRPPPLSSEVRERLVLLGSCFKRSTVERGESLRRSPGVLGRMSFFCLLAGRISSRSTGTPKETRKRRRMRERSQLGGWRGGGAESWE